MTTQVPKSVRFLGDQKACDNRNPMVLPALVACGYRRITIPKSGNSFPAFLVAFQASSDNKSGEDTTTNIKDGNSSLRGARFAWRSKKDFLLLARKGVEPQEKCFPKAALKKVVDENTVPWRRSSLPRTTTSFSAVGRFSECGGDTTIVTAMEQGDHHHRQFGDDAIPNCLCEINLPNYFSARMKKSIWQLDRFLQSMQSKAENSKQRQNAWEFFCRHSDTDDLVTPPEFSALEILRSAKQDDINIQDANKNNPPCDQASAASANANKTIDASTTLKESSRLGQYFASKENSRNVVDCALEKILPLYCRGDIGEDKKRSSTTTMIFVEPSCGHGDIVVSLVEALKEHGIPPSSVWIMGYDIDPGAIQTCRERKEFRPGAAKSSIGNGDIDGSNASCSYYPILWECKSFFETSRERCINDFNAFFNNIKDNDSGCIPAVKDRELLVCCLGGPPYTTGQGSGSAMKRDLPERFVDHCFTEWKADVVSFLLPARYKEGTKKILCDNGTLVTKLQATGTIATTKAGPTDECNTTIWIRETRELKESNFFFRGTTKVTQPSIIKLFYASETGKQLAGDPHSNFKTYDVLAKS